MLNTPERPILNKKSEATPTKYSTSLGYLNRRIHARQKKAYEYEEMKANEAEAKAAYNELVELGARPSRPMREEFAYHTWPYKTSLPKFEGFVEWYDAENRTRDHAEESSLMLCHWEMERNLFQGQLHRWKEFRKAQATSQEDQHLRNCLLIRPTEISALRSIDPVLTQRLTMIQDWRAYRAYCQGKVARLDFCRMAARDQVSQLRFTFVRLADVAEKDKRQAHLLKKVFHLRIHHETWLAEKALLGRVDAEIFKILEETVDELSVRDPALLREFEENTTKVAQYFTEELGNLSGSEWRLRPLRAPTASLSALERLYQWEREISRLSDLYQEWKENLECLQMSHDSNDENASYPLSPKRSVVRDRSLWERHVHSRQQHLVNAKDWQRCWEDVEEFCAKEGAAHLGNFFPANYLETIHNEQGLAFVSIQEAAHDLKIAEQEAAEALISHDQPKQLSKFPQDAPSTWVDAKIVRKRKADDEGPMEPQAKRICLPWKVSAADKLEKYQRRPVLPATPTSINSTWKRDPSTSPATKVSPSTAVKTENNELPWEGSAANNFIVPQDPRLLLATPTSANSAPSPTKRAQSAPPAPNPSSSTATSAEGEGPQVNTKKTSRGTKVARTSQKDKAATTKSNKDKGKASVTKTGRVTKPKVYRAEAKANGGVRRSERIKEMKKNLRCRQGGTEMHEHLC